MEQAYNALSHAQLALYLLLAVVALAGWRARRGPGGAWLTSAFLIIGGVLGAAAWLPDEPGGTFTDQLARKALLAVLVVFPYALFRFTTEIRPTSRALAWAAAGLTAFVALVPFAMGDIPGRRGAGPGPWQVYRYVLGLQWAGISAVAFTVLWRGGSGQPTAIRRRMRALAVGGAGLAVGAVISVTTTSPKIGPATIVTQLISLVSAIVLTVAASPPRWLLAAWRQADLGALREAEQRLVSAVVPEEVAGQALAKIARLVGGRGAIMTYYGEVIGAFGVTRIEIDDALKGEPPDARIVIRVPMRSGALTIFLESSAPYFGLEEQRLVSGFALMADMALDRIEGRARERAMAEAQRDLLATTSHDLRTPLAVMHGYASLLTSRWESLSDAEKRQFNGVIERQVRNISRMVDDLLLGSRIGSDVVMPVPEVISLPEAVDDAVAALGHLGGTVTVRMPADLQVTADPDHFRRIVGNLLSNAFAYGRPPVEVTAGRSGPVIELRVRDGGDGVPAEFVPRLFQRFSRAGLEGPGSARTGLGLYIVGGLVRAAGGEVRYESTGRGSCFVVTLPAVDAPGRGATEALAV